MKTCPYCAPGAFATRRRSAGAAGARGSLTGVRSAVGGRRTLGPRRPMSASNAKVRADRTLRRVRLVDVDCDSSRSQSIRVRRHDKHMADTATAVTAIVVSGAVGPGLAAWWARTRQKDDQRQQLQVELRQVLDEGAHALGQSKRCFERVWVLQNRGTSHDSPDAKEASQAWRRTLTDVRYSEDRIALRLGDGHPVHAAFVQCMKELEAQRPLAWAYERGSITQEILADQTTAHKQFRVSRHDYVCAAKACLDK